MQCLCTASADLNIDLTVKLVKVLEPSFSAHVGKRLPPHGDDEERGGGLRGLLLHGPPGRLGGRPNDLIIVFGGRGSEEEETVAGRGVADADGAAAAGAHLRQLVHRHVPRLLLLPQPRTVSLVWQDYKC